MKGKIDFKVSRGSQGQTGNSGSQGQQGGSGNQVIRRRPNVKRNGKTPNTAANTATNTVKKKTKIKLPTFSMPSVELPHLWLVDLIGIVLTIAGAVAVYTNYKTIETVILYVIVSLLDLLGLVLLFGGMLFVLYLFLFRRR